MYPFSAPDPRDSVELSGRPVQSSDTGRPEGGNTPDKTGYLRIYFSCANAYTRAQKTPSGDGYTARCPQCGMMKKLLIGPGGTSDRSFVLSCR